MPKFRNIRDYLKVAYIADVVDDAEFVLLYDTVKSKNRDLPYWLYNGFDLDSLSNCECEEEFRFSKNDIFLLYDALNIPEDIICYNGTKINGIEGLCIFLKRFAYPCRYSDMIPRFGRSVPELCLASNYVMDYLYANYHHKLTSLNQPWLAPACLEEFCAAIHQSGAALQSCWGFIDGTVRPICRPGEFQRVLYNGHKRVHAIKFQSVVAPNGLVANLYGPVEGKRHDAGMLVQSNLLQSLSQHSYSTTGATLCIYGDPAYPLRPHLQAPFRSAHLTNDEKSYNMAMSKVRVSVEWIFGDIVNYFAFLDFKKKLKIKLSAIGKMYITCALMHNARACLYGNLTSNYFGVEPPELNNYFT